MKSTLEIVQSLDLPEEMERMAIIFDQGMPDTLYMNHYELAEKTGIPSERWEEFLDLKEIQRFIQSKTAKLAEVAARKAIRELERRGSETTSGAIKALNDIIEKSKILQQANRRTKQIVFSYMPPRQEAPRK